MTENINMTPTEVATDALGEGVRELEAPERELEASRTTQALPTEWADAIPGNFDGDQSAIHAWVIATEEERAEVLANMRFADAEALVDAAAEVAKVHEERAREARALGINVAKRLGREAQKLQTGTMPVTTAQTVAADTAALGVIK